MRESHNRATAFMNTPGDSNIRKPHAYAKMYLSSVVVCSFSQKCACAEAATEAWNAVYVNRKRFGAESNLIYRIESNRAVEGLHTGGFLSVAGC